MSLVVFNVYEPPVLAGDRLDRAERLVFVKDGFHWMAALFPVIWLPLKGLWLELVVLVVVGGLLIWGLAALGANNELVSILLLIVQIVIGYQAADIRGAALERRGWRMAGSITGRNREECEARFLASWLPAQPEMDYERNPTSPSGSAPPRSWPSAAWNDIKESFARGRQLART